MTESIHDFASDDRYGTQRGRYISKTTELRLPEAKAVAYSELGYSRSGIASKMDTSTGTVKKYHERAAALYGLEALEQMAPDATHTELERVDEEYALELTPGRRETWVEMVERQKKSLPQEWVNDVLPE